MSAADPLQEVSDLKRKLRLIKNKLLDPTERNVRQAINMIDDTFATEEIHLNCSRYGITCTPPAMYVVPGFTPQFPESPVTVQPAATDSPARTFANANIQTETPKLKSSSTQTTDTGDISLYTTTQTNLQNAIDLLTETKNSLTDRGKKRKHDGVSQRSSGPSSSSTAVCSISQFPRAVATPKGRPVTHLQRVHKSSESKPVPSNMLISSEKLAIGDGFSGKYTPVRDKNFDPVSADKRKKIKDIEFACKYCDFRGDSEQCLFYHDCTILPQVESPFICCGTSYKHRGYYARHRDMKHKKQYNV
ncbi:hypothetical protein PRIPAC_89316 [Pristionchus pacificus]|uniref:Uncharacterized protein n=1 Tax=Pristionchus pacificus TaxID=54126 RepID=A0A2A6CYQ4_PRIPA|nr:hypothetical protein PRIPAC_89316 [Pristionchus pacificus]|eukprot:PDM83305.1 hypothetical protein PRIPAC_34937 [Pristionchus pacificus]